MSFVSQLVSIAENMSAHSADGGEVSGTSRGNNDIADAGEPTTGERTGGWI